MPSTFLKIKVLVILFTMGSLLTNSSSVPFHLPHLLLTRLKTIQFTLLIGTFRGHSFYLNHLNWFCIIFSSISTLISYLCNLFASRLFLYDHTSILTSLFCHFVLFFLVASIHFHRVQPDK